MKRLLPLVLLFVPCLAHSQVTVGLLPLPFCGSVSPNTIGAKIQTNVSGTSTPLNTYTDSTGTTPNQNPVTLTGNSMQVWGISGNLYRLIVMDQNSVQQCQVDGVSPIGGGGGGGSANWSSLLPGTNNNSGTFIANGNGWDFSLANLFKAPVAAGILLSAPGSFGYDSSGNKWQFFQNGSQVGFGVAGSCAANQFATSLSATAAPTCAQPSAANLSNGTTGSGPVALATSPALVTPTIGGTTITNVPTMAWSAAIISANILNEPAGVFVTHSPITITDFNIGLSNDDSGCTTTAIYALFDETASSTLSSITLVNGTFSYFNGGLSTAVTSGHTLDVRVTRLSSGCALFENGTATMQYRMQ